MDNDKIRKNVREGYAKIAEQESSCCYPVDCGCGPSSAQEISKGIGYSDKELGAVPEGANLGLGCGNPTAIASLQKGETVLDLGSGPGFDCFLAANKVGKQGKVIGVDMTSKMIEKARENAKKGGYENVEFRLGEIEHLPVADNSVDVVISNCVINLSTDKKQVFAEAFRVLRPGGRIVISDVVITKELPKQIKDSVEAYIGCLSGAMLKEEYLKTIEKTGFKEINVIGETVFPIDLMLNDPTAQAIIENSQLSLEKIKKINNSIISIKFSGVKPLR